LLTPLCDNVIPEPMWNRVRKSLGLVQIKTFCFNIIVKEAGQSNAIENVVLHDDYNTKASAAHKDIATITLKPAKGNFIC